jgi:AbrB family looped-hinge helix DNA binding protein
MATTVITTKGQVVIPAEIRHKLKIKKGTKFYVEERGQEIVLKPITPDYFDKMAGILPGKGKATKAVLQERALDKEKEETK